MQRATGGASPQSGPASVPTDPDMCHRLTYVSHKRNPSDLSSIQRVGRSLAVSVGTPASPVLPLEG